MKAVDVALKANQITKPHEGSSLEQISPNNLKELLKQNSSTTFLLDVREPWEYKIAHLENSVLIPINQIPDKLDSLDKNKQIICICHHGIRSMQVGRYLEENGFQNIKNLTGGIDAWSIEVDASVERY